MKEIRFDFNNLFSFSVGKTHGAEEKDLVRLLASIRKAHRHLKELSADALSRKELGLEWVRLPFQDKETVEGIERLGGEIAAKYDNVISLGIGGSYLGLKAAQDALCPAYYNEFASLRRKRPRIYFEGNNLDPDTLQVLLRNLDPRKTLVIVISKSGETTETKAAFMVVREWLKKALASRYGRAVIAITDPESGSLRREVLEEQKKDKLSLRSLPLLKGVGGRFSEFNIGLLHLAIAGINIREVLKGAAAMQKRCSRPDLFKNPAYMYAALHTILYKNKAKPIAIMMPFSETLKATADWYVQLLAESLGKKYARKINFKYGGRENWSNDPGRIVNVGRTPIPARGTNDLHSIQQNNVEGENNKVISFIRVEKFKSEIKIPANIEVLGGRRFSELIRLAQEATEWALVREQRPNCTVIVPAVSPYYWGGLIFFFEMATAFEGELLNINAFDQPGVEGYKNYMYYKLKKAGIKASLAREIEKYPLIKKKRFVL